MGTLEENKSMVNKYQIDNTILESYFKNASNQNVVGMTFPLRIDNRQYCSPTDYQGSKPSCCGYTAAQILESLNWMRTGTIRQFDADQIYAKAKQMDGRMGVGGTFPDLAMMKGLELVGWTNQYAIRTSNGSDISQLKRAVHQNLFASVNMKVTKDIYDIDGSNFVYRGSGQVVGGHSLVCCGYDEESKMLILQNHWGTIWGLKGFFLCPYDVWIRQNNLTCWYERTTPTGAKASRKSHQKKMESSDSKIEDLKL